MQWLVSQMWIALAVAGFLGFLFGLTLRGLMAENKVRRARADRDIAKTELEQARVEVDALFAAQRKRKDEAGEPVASDDGLTADLADRDAKIGVLDDELAAVRAELVALKSEVENADISNGSLAGQAGAALAGAAVGAAASDSDASEALKERNVWLEERVAALETDLSHANGSADTGDVETGSGVEKLQWQNNYLQQRVEALEGEVSGLPVAGAATATVALAEGGDAAPGEGDEELATLRWRNRYLESRLAYHEGDDAEAQDDAETDSVAEEDKEIATPVLAPVVDLAEDEVAEAGDEADASSVEDAATELADDGASEPVAAAEAIEDAEDFEEVVDEIAGDEEHPSDAVLKQLGEDIEDSETDAIQPEQIDAPSEGGGDDLTEIGGIGPRIAEVLNELGIWTYAQIATWTPENAAWVEQHLSFKGRVTREHWIEQAKELVADTEAAEA